MAADARRHAETVAVIVNPISGTGGRPEIARQRLELAAAVLRSRAPEAALLVSERAGHAPLLARAAVERGVRLIIAWGGDGTINEIASELVFRDVTLGIIPSGSGNGLARELGIPFQPQLAFQVAFEGRTRTIDAGELDKRLFFNVAGIGLDARVAHEFATNGLVRRGFARYVQIAVRELFAFQPDEHTILADGEALRTRALLIALANGRQYGNGALIAPAARIDDGRLEVVVVEARAPAVALAEAPLLFAGRIARLRGVVTRSAERVQVTSRRPAIYHVDGEPFVGSATLEAAIHPGALRVRVP